MNRLRPVDEDHEFNPTDGPAVGHKVKTTTESRIPFYPVLPEDEYEAYELPDYNSLDFYEGVYQPIDMPTHKPKPKPTTRRPRPTTTTTTEDPIYSPDHEDGNYDFNSYPYDAYNYDDNQFVGTFLSDAYKRHKLFLKQKLKERHRKDKFHRRRHRHHRHRSFS